MSELQEDVNDWSSKPRVKNHKILHIRHRIYHSWYKIYREIINEHWLHLNKTCMVHVNGLDLNKSTTIHKLIIKVDIQAVYK